MHLCKSFQLEPNAGKFLSRKVSVGFVLLCSQSSWVLLSIICEIQFNLPLYNFHMKDWWWSTIVQHSLIFPWVPFGSRYKSLKQIVDNPWSVRFPCLTEQVNLQCFPLHLWKQIGNSKLSKMGIENQNILLIENKLSLSVTKTKSTLISNQRR